MMKSKVMKWTFGLTSTETDVLIFCQKKKKIDNFHPLICGKELAL